jgi:hypothetical protein
MSSLLGSLALKVNSMGVAKAARGMGTLQARMGRFTKRMDPAFKKMSKTLTKFGAVATGAFFALAAASPLLQARLEVLNLRVQQLMRDFGDGLAPIVESMTDIVERAIEIWEGLPGPLQDAIIFGTQVAAVLGLIALAAMFLSAAISPVTLAILAIIAASALLYLIWTQNLFGIQGITEDVFGAIGDLFAALVVVAQTNIQYILNYIEAIVGTLEGVRDFIKAIFKGDIDAALEAIGGIFKTWFDFIVKQIKLPLTALEELLKIFEGNDLKDRMWEAGKALFEAFLEGMGYAIDAAGGIVGEAIGAVSDWLGGSLPEKGPLMHVPEYGQELGEAYVQGIASGIATTTTTTFNRIFNIENIGIEVPGITDEEGQGFMSRLDTGIRRATL